MAETIRINTEEYNEEFSRKLKVGDSVLITGKIYSARDAAHKVMTEALARGEKLPIDWTNKFVYYLGPTPAKPGDPIGSAGPTTSGRMDAYTPTAAKYVQPFFFMDSTTAGLREPLPIMPLIP